MTSLAQGSAGLALVLSFALLCPRQVTTALHLLVVQAGVVAVAAAARNQPIAAAGEVLLGALLAPIVVGRLLDRLNIAHTTLAAGGTRLAVMAGAIVALLAMPIGPLGLPLAVVLLAILLIATRRHPVMQLIGLLAMQNGLVLAALEADWAGRYAAICPVVPGLIAAALWLRPPATRPARQSIGG